MKKRLSFILLSVAALLVSLAAGPVFGQGEVGQGRAGEVVPDSYIVILQDGVSPNQVAKDHGVAGRHTYTAAFNGFSGKVAPGQVKKLREDPRVQSVSANRVVQAHPKPENPGGKNKSPQVDISNPADGLSFAS